MSDSSFQAPTISENWAPYLCHIDEKPAFISLNLDLSLIAPVNHFNKVAHLIIALEQPNAEGFPQGKELETLYAIEDTILDALATDQQPIILAGTLKTGGVAHLFIYTTTDATEETINNVMKNQFQDYEYLLRTIDDEAWDIYNNVLYPDPYHLEVIHNQNVLRSLAEHGDNFDQPRNVDHLIYFFTKEEASQFISEAEKERFAVITQEGDANIVEHSDKAGTYYSVTLVREDVITPVVLHQYVWNLVQLANKYNGHYDGWGCDVTR